MICKSSILYRVFNTVRVCVCVYGIIYFAVLLTNICELVKTSLEINKIQLVIMKGD